MTESRNVKLVITVLDKAENPMGYRCARILRVIMMKTLKKEEE